jgi:hypothetical protein
MRPSPHSDAVPHRRPPHEGVAGTPDFVRQFLDIAAGQLRVDARPAGILQLDLCSVKINHFHLPQCEVADKSGLSMRQILDPSE